MKVIDLTNQQFGKLTVLRRVENDNSGRTRWECKCECGNIKIISGAELRRTGNRVGTRSCGKCQNLIDLTGKRFGRLTVIERFYDNSHNYNSTGAKWICQCDCGNKKIVAGHDLRNQKITSCGCYRKELFADIKALNLLKQQFGKLTVIERIPNENGHSMWLCQCSCGNKIKVACNDLISGKNSCGCSNSRGEAVIENFLQKYHYNYKKQFTFSDLLSENNNPLKFDFGVLDNNNQLIFLIEYDGEQHFKEISFFGSLEQQQARDNLKNNYCSLNSIPLIRFNYTELKILTDDYILNKIQKELHLNE